MPFNEKRKYPRVAETVSCRLSVGGESFVARTQNISCGGVLCELPLPLPAMTRLSILLELPSGNLEERASPIRCTGVVVRQEQRRDPSGKGYWTAIYFQNLLAQERKRIAEFVLQSMLAHDRRHP